MRKNKGNVRRDRTGRAATHPPAAPPVDTAEQREKVRRGLRVLAKIIARAHLRRQSAQWEVMGEAANGERLRAAPHGPPLEEVAGG